MAKENDEFRFDANVPQDIQSKMNASWKTNPKQDYLDSMMVRHFPKFIFLGIDFAIISMILMHASALAEIIYSICIGFVVSFFILGLISFALSEKGAVNWKFDITIFIATPVIISMIFWIFGDDFKPSQFLVSVISIFNIHEVNLFYLISAVIFIFLAVFFVSFGVVSVIVAYFRSYTFRILRFVAKSKDSDSRKKRFAYKFFMIPDIIDVEDVNLDPVEDKDGFDMDIFMNTAVSLFLLGLVICSYIFLNPFFLTEMPFDEMVVIAFMLSLFMSPLVIPWSIMRSIGANVKSQARPYYLWKGMKSRMYQGFFAITFIMMILMLSAYLGMDFSRIATTYLGYILLMTLVSVFTAYIYTNYFYKGFKRGIIVSYYERKYRNKE